jgi:hypothetical protein
MAYFSNGTEGMAFDEECSTCKYFELACPIALMQVTYNYDAVNNDIATKILNGLVKNDGTCKMKELTNNFDTEKDKPLVSMEEIKNILKPKL